MQAALSGYLTIWSVIGVGWVVAHLRVLTEQHRRMLARLAFTVASPALLLGLVSRADLGHLFSGDPMPTCPDAADANDDGKLDIADAVKILGHLFAGSGPLPAPFGDCGTEEQPDQDGLPRCDYQGRC